MSFGDVMYFHKYILRNDSRNISTKHYCFCIKCFNEEMFHIRMPFLLESITWCMFGVCGRLVVSGNSGKFRSVCSSCYREKELKSKTVQIVQYISRTSITPQKPTTLILHTWFTPKCGSLG